MPTLGTWSMRAKAEDCAIRDGTVAETRMNLGLLLLLRETTVATAFTVLIHGDLRADPAIAVTPPNILPASPARAPSSHHITDTMADAHTYKFNVTMSCGGCSGAINRVLGKLDGVQSYDVSLEKQEAVVVASPGLDYETVLKTIKKTGKKVNSGEVDGESKSIELLE
ncbi:hypothetical protein CHU98_g5051 [Xylaria longipes]|nr:hypothetical protein CHU98_g5051 [Xylaria longipes]